jgi:hypothetical protein
MTSFDAFWARLQSLGMRCSTDDREYALMAWNAARCPKKDLHFSAPVIRMKESTRTTMLASAQQLGVTREHLSRVLHGHRESRRLTQRYAALMAGTATVAPADPAPSTENPLS